MLMFVVSNIIGSTIQITTLPLPVLSTLQAVSITMIPIPPFSLLTHCRIIVRPRLQYHFRYRDPW